MSKNVVVVGGGLAGLAAAIYLARAGRPVTVFERRRGLGGRAVTHIRQGFRFNVGPHAVYRAGAAWNVYRELGIPVRGGSHDGSGVALSNGTRYRLPAGLFSLVATSMLSPKAKVEATGFLFRLRKLDASRFRSMTVREWLDSSINDPNLRLLIEAWLRVASYSAAAGEQSASVAIDQLKHARRGIVYVDEGWQKLVDAMHSHAIAAGVNFVTSSRVVRVDHEGNAVKGIELGELEVTHHGTQSLELPAIAEDGERGTHIPAATVLLAVDPSTARSMTGGFDWPEARPVAVACLDVALRTLPRAHPTFAIGIDRPVYYSVHSRWAKLTPRGGALIHVAKYVSNEEAVTDDDLDQSMPPVRGSENERELEGVLDELQPGWREALVHRRFLPAITVSHALTTPGGRRPPVNTPVRGLYIAGDWVGDEGILSDAALSSARAAAKAILAET